MWRRFHATHPPNGPRARVLGVDAVNLLHRCVGAVLRARSEQAGGTFCPASLHEAGCVIGPCVCLPEPSTWLETLYLSRKSVCVCFRKRLLAAVALHFFPPPFLIQHESSHQRSFLPLDTTTRGFVGATPPFV